MSVLSFISYSLFMDGWMDGWILFDSVLLIAFVVMNQYCLFEETLK